MPITQKSNEYLTKCDETKQDKSAFYDRQALFVADHFSKFLYFFKKIEFKKQLKIKDCELKI